MPFILPSGSYYDASPHVAVGSIEVAVRPSEDHKLTPNWELDPLNANAAWMPKTPVELQAEEDATFNARIDNDHVLKSLFDELNVLSPGFRARVQIKSRKT